MTTLRAPTVRTVGFLGLCLLTRSVLGQDVKWRGVDVSYLPQIEEAGGIFHDDYYDERPLPDILAQKGVNLARIRLWVNPAEGHGTLSEALNLAERLQTAGVDGIMINLHFSDTWADRNSQTKPVAWQNLNFEDLAENVEAYTKDVMTAFIARGITPEAVQLGNDILDGILWPEGRVGGSYNTAQQWEHLGIILWRATTGVRSAFSGSTPLPKIVLHLANGGENSACRWFFDNLFQRFVDFDVIGVSFWPWLHEDFGPLEYNLADLATHYDKDVAVVETAYPYTLDSYDNVFNPVGSEQQLFPGYPATTDGQRKYLSMLRYKLAMVPQNHGIGMIYWEPDWIPTPRMGSSWENLALFNFWGAPLPAFYALGEVTPPPKPNSNFDVKWHGVDVSFLPQVEAGGGKYRENGNERPLPEILRSKGINIARVRLFHTPFDGNYSLDYVLNLAQRMSVQGIALLLDIHLSDDWADPKYQRRPAAWVGLNFNDLVNSVEAYTREVMEAFIDRGVAPVAVQLGNEITGGILFTEGQIGYNYTTPEQWNQFRTLLRRAGAGLKSAFYDANMPAPTIILHHSRGGDNAVCRWFFDEIVKYNDVPFDIIGLSYYNWWSGMGAHVNFKRNAEDLAARYGKDLLLVETGYPWTLEGSFDSKIDTLDSEYQLLPGYPPTPEGQWNFLTVRNIVADIPNGRGLGMLYWSPEWISAPSFVSEWENLALFDASWNALPGFAALG